MSRWLPAAAVVAYLATVAVMAPGLVAALPWDTDVAAPFVLAERVRGHGDVLIPHYGSWSVLWTLLATRGLPGHDALWAALGYVFCVAGAALVGWATSRVAGRWAGITAFAIAIVVGPYALRSQLTVIFHVLPPFTAALLAAYLVVLARSHRRVALAGAVGVVAGVNAASDALGWPAAVVPFALASALLFAATRRKSVALCAGVLLSAALISAVATDIVMRHLGYHVIGLDLTHTQVSALAGNIRHLARMVALLGGANYALPGGYPPEPLRVVVALLAAAGVAASVLSAVKQLSTRTDPLRRAYACYWGASVVLLSLSFVLTTNAVALGAGSANYLLTFAPAAGAGVAVLASTSERARLATGSAVVLVAVTNLVGIAQGHAGTPKGAVGVYKPRIVETLARAGVSRGYGGYWDAQNLSWQTDMRLLVAPVQLCANALCSFDFSTIRSWYEPHPGPSFLIVDPTNGVIVKPPPFARRARARYRFGPLTIYVFGFDIARYIASDRSTTSAVRQATTFGRAARAKVIPSSASLARGRPASGGRVHSDDALRR